MNAASAVTARYGRAPDGRVLGIAENGAVALAVSNTHDDVVAGLSPDGTSLLGAAKYDPFGNTIGSTGTSVSLGYQGEYTDPTTARVHMHARWYTPTTGAFAARDSLTLEPAPSIQANRYTYGNGNPLGNTDPTGHFSCCTLPDIDFDKEFGDIVKRNFKKPSRILGLGRRGGMIGMAVAGAAVAGWYLGHNVIGPPLLKWWNNSFMRSGPATPPRAVSLCAFNWPNFSPGCMPPRAGAPGPDKDKGRDLDDDGQPDPPAQPLRDLRRKAMELIAKTQAPRPPMKPGVSQEYLDKLRDGVESTIDAAVGVLNLDGVIDPFASADAREERRAPSGGNTDTDRCTPHKDYGTIDSAGRRSGISATFCSAADLAGGTRANPNTTPPGWPNKHDGRTFARGHLLAKALGGSGDVESNLVTLYQKRANSPVMRSLELQVRAAVLRGEVVRYNVTPIYHGAAGMPAEVRIQAQGNNGLNICRYVQNTPQAGTHDCS